MRFPRTFRHQIILPCCLLFLLVWTLKDESYWKWIALPGEKALNVKRPSNLRPRANRLDSAVCTGDLLDQRHHHFEKETDGSYRFTSDQSEPCRLVWYTTERIVSCFDSLRYAKWPDGSLSERSNNSLHFLFMGDSRIRQQFYNFAALIPDYDQIRQPIQLSSGSHDNIEITSNILNLRLSFKWRHLLDDNVIDTVRRLATSDSSERPHLLFFSIVVHHMLGIHGADHRLYEEQFKKLAPELGRLANVSQVILFNQYPVEELQEKNYDINTYIHSGKIDNYNKAIRRLLENESSRIRIWDSSDPLAEEYVRSCVVLERDEVFYAGHRPYLSKDTAFADCNDFIHTGYSALSEATNLLYNDICNNVMDWTQ
ncbi:uncharacterized protein LOC130690407 [Daphnia carinata]|uniref:uncharacterized protein LOC130690407 n=1 Tax=Daphnia carinata TaxID=120202 RepID=UPI00257DF556|nr:uncharacterized protein LOC130690407 [Daphnia carinata]